MVETIDLYTCSKVPEGHPTGLVWRAAGSAPDIVAGRAESTIASALGPYEVRHLPRPAG